MKNPARIFLILSIFLVMCVTIMGCSSSSSGSTATPTSGTVTTATTIAPLYTAGDIVWSASASTTAAWLIISYDPSTDSYTRAYIHKNTDGSWGYRTNSETDTSPRSTMEKVYTVKITHVTVSSIPTAAPTLVVPTTVVTTVTTTAATAATTTAAGKPSFKDIVPNEGTAGTSVAITDLLGSNFQSGATVQLAHAGTIINATSVVWTDASDLTCTIVIPSNSHGRIMGCCGYQPGWAVRFLFQLLHYSWIHLFGDNDDNHHICFNRVDHDYECFTIYSNEGDGSDNMVWETYH